MLGPAPLTVNACDAVLMLSSVCGLPLSYSCARMLTVCEPAATPVIVYFHVPRMTFGTLFHAPPSIFASIAPAVLSELVITATASPLIVLGRLMASDGPLRST